MRENKNKNIVKKSLKQGGQIYPKNLGDFELYFRQKER